MVTNKIITADESPFVITTTLREEDKDVITIECDGEDNLNEMLAHIKTFNGTIH